MQLELWIIYALAFGAMLLGIQSLYWFFTRTQRDQKAINRRLVLAGRLQSGSEVLETLRRERGFGRSTGIDMLRGLEQLVLQTGLRTSPQRLLVLTLAAAAALFFVLSFWLGFGPLGLMLSSALAVAAVYIALRIIRRRRIARFGEQFPEALDVLVRGLLAGHPFRVALGLVAREMADPVGSEFGILADEIAFGLEPATAIENLVQRVGFEDLSFFAVAINIQSQTGGNLAEILARLSRLVRSRIKLRLKVRALSAEGRISAIFLSLAPFILFGLISLLSPSYFAAVKDNPIIVPAFIVGLVLLAIGNLIIYRMVNFKV